MALIDNLDRVAFTTVFDTDKIIGTLSGSTFSVAPTAITSVTTTAENISTGFGEPCYYKGIFSIDGGTTWNDFDAMVPNTSTPGSPVFDTQNCFAEVRDNFVQLRTENWYNSVAGSGAAYTFLWKIVLFSKNGQGSIEPLPIAQQEFFTSKNRRYEMIAQQGEETFNINSSAGQTVVVSHSLGYVPRVQAFYREFSPTSRIQTPYPFNFIETIVTSTDVTFHQETALAIALGKDCTGQIEYRIYY